MINYTDTSSVNIYTDTDDDGDAVKGGAFGGHFTDGVFTANFLPVDVGTRYTYENAGTTTFKTESTDDVSMFEFASALILNGSKTLDSITFTATTSSNYRINDFAVFAVTATEYIPAGVKGFEIITK